MQKNQEAVTKIVQMKSKMEKGRTLRGVFVHARRYGFLTFSQRQDYWDLGGYR